MSQIKLAPASGGTGDYTIVSQATNTNRTFTLPDKSGEIMVGSGIVQVIQTYKTNIYTSTATGPYQIPGLAVTITPTSSTSKILVMANLNAGVYANAFAIYLYRGTTNIGRPDSVSGKNNRYWLNVYNGGDDTNSTPNWGMMYLDSPATTSATTYSLYGHRVQGGTFVLNDQTSQVTNQSYAGNSVSHITVMEVAQ
jgi:hypothetical protein